MLALPLLRAAALAAALSCAAACGGDDEIDDDGGDGPSDSGPPDAGFDAENLCPGALTFEALAQNLVTGANEFEVAVAEAADPGNTASSAPNGRVVLCLPDGADSAIEVSKADYLTRADPIPAAAASVYTGAGQPYPLYVVEQAAAETLYEGLGTTLDAADAQVMISVIAYPDGTPLAGAAVAIDKASDGPFTRDASGGFTATDGDQVAAGGLVLFANVPVAGGDLEVTVTPPGEFAGTCEGPTALPLTAGQVSGALFACHQ